MAINKKLIHFKSKQKFNEELAKGNILETSIVFILETTEIYTHGLFYAGSTFDPSDIEASIQNIINNKQDTITDLEVIRQGAAKGATSIQQGTLSTVAASGSYNDLSDKPSIPSAVTESTVSGWGFTKNTGTYSKPSGGIPKSDLASAVQTSLGKADTALQSYTEQYKGTITGVSANGTSISTSGVANIPAASTSAYGVTKLSSATNSTSTTLAATASAVKAAYDLANGKQDKVVSAGGTAKIDWNNDIDNVPGIRNEGTYIDFTQPINVSDGFFFDSEYNAAGGKLTLDNDGIHYEIFGDVLDVPATMDIIHTGDGTKFLSDDGTYKEVNSGGSSSANVAAVDTEDVVDDVNVEYTTKTYVDGLVEDINNTIGDINSVLESIINGSASPTIITFNVSGSKYQAEEGMTFYDWGMSKYYDSNIKLVVSPSDETFKESCQNYGNTSTLCYNRAGMRYNPNILLNSVIQPITYTIVTPT